MQLKYRLLVLDAGKGQGKEALEMWTVANKKINPKRYYQSENISLTTISIAILASVKHFNKFHKNKSNYAMELIVNCYLEQLFASLDSSTLILGHRRRLLVEFFSDVIESCATGDLDIFMINIQNTNFVLFKYLDRFP